MKNSKEESIPTGIAGLIGSLGAITLGATLMLHDYRDFGKLGVERDPPVPHHGIYGILIFIGGIAGTCISGLSLLSKLGDFDGKDIRKDMKV